MNNKMAINTYLSKMNLKNKLSKQKELRQNHGSREHFDGCQMGGVYRIMGEEVRGLRSTSRQLQNSHGDVKYGIGNGVAKELICMTRGYEQWWGNYLREQGGLGARGGDGETLGQL